MPVTSSPSPSPSPSPSASPSASPSPSRSPSPSPSASPTGSPGAACSATYKVTNAWEGGFQGEVAVTAGGAAIGGWTVTWTFAGGQAVTQSWNAALAGSGSSVTARNTDGNGALAAGASTTFGFLASGASTPVPALTCTAR
ncbi:cellulose binding domain-containing protein [Microbispora siamensis]